MKNLFLFLSLACLCVLSKASVESIGGEEESALLRALGRKEMAGIYHTVGFPGEADVAVFSPGGTLDAQFVFPNLNPIQPNLENALNNAPGSWDIKQYGKDKHIVEFTFFELMVDTGNITFVNGECNPACFIAAYAEGEYIRSTGVFTFTE